MADERLARSSTWQLCWNDHTHVDTQGASVELLMLPTPSLSLHVVPHILFTCPPPPPFFHFTCDQAHMWRAVTHLPVMLKSAGFCVMYGNKRGVWARSDTLPPTRHSLNAYESQVESCRLAWCVCARMRWCFLIHKTFLYYCVWVLCDLCVSGLTA